MSDIRLESIPFELQGKTYQLRCNMNVLADVQEEYGGDLGAAINEASPIRSVLHFLAAMLNDYAEEQGWPERFSHRQLGRIFPNAKKIPAADVMRLVTTALVPDTTVSGDTEAAESGN